LNEKTQNSTHPGISLPPGKADGGSNYMLCPTQAQDGATVTYRCQNSGSSVVSGLSEIQSDYRR